MSGFEVAGAVLGAIPIVITTLQQARQRYQESRRNLQYFRKNAQYINILIDSLEFQKTVIEADLKALIRVAAASILDDPASINVSNCSQLLDREDVRQGLEDHLGERSEPIRKTLKRCEKSLKDIVARISECTGAVVSRGKEESMRSLTGF